MLSSSKRLPKTEGAAIMELILSSHKVKVEQVKQDDGTYQYRFISGDLASEQWMTSKEFEERIQEEGNLTGRPWYHQLFNVSKRGQFVWVALGLGGQIVFSGRMVVQWLASEKSRKSVVPAAFWYMSLAGAMALSVYFIWRQDIIALFGQTAGLVIYVRNIRLLHLDKNRTE
jgi:lipid-A-disaccharide synthase-like uncharacterized protein